MVAWLVKEDPESATSYIKDPMTRKEECQSANEHERLKEISARENTKPLRYHATGQVKINSDLVSAVEMLSAVHLHL